MKLAGVPAISCNERPKIFRGGCKGIKARFSRILLNNASSSKKIVPNVLETTARQLRLYSAVALQCKGLSEPCDHRQAWEGYLRAEKTLRVRI